MVMNQLNLFTKLLMGLRIILFVDHIQPNQACHYKKKKYCSEFGTVLQNGVR